MRRATRSDFEVAFEALIGHEGGYVNDPRDPGGETKYGISKRSYPQLDIRNITLRQAHDIYWRDFFQPIGAHELSPRVAYILFDAAVNNGPNRAVRWLQQALNVSQDGQFGPQTRQAAQRAIDRDEEDLLVEFHAHRLRFMAGLNTWPTFRGGWSRRLVRLPFEACKFWPAANEEEGA